MVRYFDLIYYTLSILILLFLGLAVTLSVGVTHKTQTPASAKAALGIRVAAVGTVIALVGGLLADALLKNSTFFQQARFAGYYIGFALITWGLSRVGRQAQETQALPKLMANRTMTGTIPWALFLVTLAAALFYLLNPATFVRNPSGSQIQLVVYWIPMLTTSAVEAMVLIGLALAIKVSDWRAFLLWSGSFSALVFIGLLRESLILPDLGDPLSNLLAAFGPFAIGSLCLFLAAGRLNRLLTIKNEGE